MSAAQPDPVAALLDGARAERPDLAAVDVVAAWRLVPAPELVALLEELVPWLPEPVHHLRRRATWKQALASGKLGDVPAIGAALGEVWAPAELAHLAGAAADPRLSLAVAQQLARAPVQDRPWILIHLIELGDPRTVAPVARVLGDTHADVVALRRKAAKATLSRRAAAALARFAARRAAHLARDAALTAEVYAAPDDDAPRLVYGDWLQGHEDPRGELITLQFRRYRGRMSDPERRRERALIAAHGRVWRGPLRAASMTVTAFERGFVSAIQLAKIPPDLVACPAWSTVRAIDLRYQPGDVADLITRPVMRSVRDLRSMSVAQVAALGQRPDVLAIERLDLEPLHAPLGDLPALTAVTELRVRGDVGWLSRSSLLAQLRRLDVVDEHRLSAAGWLPAILRGGGRLERLTLHVNLSEYRIVRGDDRLDRLELRPRLEWETLGHNDGRVLGALPHGMIRDAVIITDVKDRARHAQQLAALLAGQPAAARIRFAAPGHDDRPDGQRW